LHLLGKEFQNVILCANPYRSIRHGNYSNQLSIKVTDERRYSPFVRRFPLDSTIVYGDEGKMRYQRRVPCHMWRVVTNAVSHLSRDQGKGLSSRRSVSCGCRSSVTKNSSVPAPRKCPARSLPRSSFHLSRSIMLPRNTRRPTSYYQSGICS
jgi:hypothetical protein